MHDTVCITGLGIISTFGSGADSYATGYQKHSVDDDCEERDGLRLLPVHGFDPVEAFGKRVAKAHDRVSQLLMGATDLLLAHAQQPETERAGVADKEDDIGIVIGTFGSMQSVVEFDLQAARAPEYVVPTQFPSTVFCAPASYVAIRHKIRAGCVTITNGETSSLQAIPLAMARLLRGTMKRVVVGGVEEVTDVYARAMYAVHKKYGINPPVLGEGAAVFTMETHDTAQSRGATELAEVLAASCSFTPTLQDGLNINLERIRSQVGTQELLAISHVFSAQKAELNEADLGIGHAEVHRLQRRLGYLGSATGAFAVATVLADPHIEPGATVLINNADNLGHSVSVLMRKLAHASRGEA